MADTLGDLVDKLTISNIRLWMLEDERRMFCHSDTTKTQYEIKTFLNKISSTNRERNSLIDQINGALRVLVDKASSRDTTFAITAEELLGSGKNKFYKIEDK